MTAGAGETVVPGEPLFIKKITPQRDPLHRQRIVVPEIDPIAKIRRIYELIRSRAG
jgi:hypothetical protein